MEGMEGMEEMTAVLERRKGKKVGRMVLEKRKSFCKAMGGRGV